MEKLKKVKVKIIVFLQKVRVKYRVFKKNLELYLKKEGKNEKKQNKK